MEKINVTISSVQKMKDFIKQHVKDAKSKMPLPF